MIMLSVIMLSIIMLSAIMVRVILLNVIIFSVIMLCVIMLGVVAPFRMILSSLVNSHHPRACTIKHFTAVIFAVS